MTDNFPSGQASEFGQPSLRCNKVFCGFSIPLGNKRSFLALLVLLGIVAFIQTCGVWVWYGRYGFGMRRCSEHGFRFSLFFSFSFGRQEKGGQKRNRLFCFILHACIRDWVLISIGVVSFDRLYTTLCLFDVPFWAVFPLVSFWPAMLARCPWPASSMHHHRCYSTTLIISRFSDL